MRSLNSVASISIPGLFKETLLATLSQDYPFLKMGVLFLLILSVRTLTTAKTSQILGIMA